MLDSFRLFTIVIFLLNFRIKFWSDLNVVEEFFVCCDAKSQISNVRHNIVIFCALQDLFQNDIKKLNRVKKTSSIKTSYYCFTLWYCYEEKNIDENFANFWMRSRFERLFNKRWIKLIIFSMIFSKRYTIIKCCTTIINLIWFEILDVDSYETIWLMFSIDRCKSWWLW